MAIRAVKWILAAFGALVALVAALVVAAVLLLDEDDYRRISAQLAEHYTGREVSIDGPLSVKLSMQPTLSVSGLRVANPAWATQRYLAQVGHLEIQIALRPLLSGVLSVPRLVLADTQFNPETSAGGEHSWDFGTPQEKQRTASPRVPLFGYVKLENVGGQYRDARTGTHTVIELSRLSVDEVDGLNRLSADGSWDDRAFGATGHLGTLSEALHPTRPFPVDLHLSYADTGLDFEGTIAEPTTAEGLDMRLAAESVDLSRLPAGLGERLGLKGHLDASAALRGNISAASLSEIRVTLTDADTSAGDPNEISVTGSVDTIQFGGERIVDGIDLRAGIKGSTAGFSRMFGAKLPELGPLDGTVALQGSSDSLAVSDVRLRAGEAGRLVVNATGGVTSVGLMPELEITGVDFDLSADAPTTAAVAEQAGVALPELGQVSVSALLTGDLEQLDLGQLDLRIGAGDPQIQVTGEVQNVLPRPGKPASVTLTGAVTPLLEGVLRKDLPELGDFHATGDLASVDERLELERVRIAAEDSKALTIVATSAADNATDAFDITVEASDLTTIGELAGLPIPALGPFSYSGHLSHEPEALRLNGTSRLGRTEIVEDISIDLSGPRPRVSGVISSAVVYLADLGIHPDGPWQGSGAENQPAPLPFAALNGLDLSMVVEVGQIEGIDMSVDRASMRLDLKDGILRIEPLQFDLVGGSFGVDAVVNAQSSPPALSADATAENIVLQQVFDQIRKTVPLDGVLDMKLDLEAQGATVPDLVSSLDGSADIVVSRGHIYNPYFDLLGSDLIHWLLLGRQARSNAELRCFIGQFALEAGDARIRALLLETAATISRASGDIDLANETLDILVQPHSRTSRLVITTPYRVDGPWGGPSVSYSRLRLAARAVAEVALAPIFTLEELVRLLKGRNNDRDNPCLDWRPTPPALASARVFEPGDRGFPVEPLDARPYVALTDTRLRRGPGTNFDPAGQFAAGDTLNVTGKVSGLNWYRVSSGPGRVGYVWGKLIRPLE